MELFRSHVLICGGTGCTSSGSTELLKRFEELLAENGLEKEVKLVHTGCFGLCEAGPVVIVYPEGAFYSRIKVENVETIVKEHLIKGRIVTSLLHKDSVDSNGAIRALDEIDFYKKQNRVALRNCGVIDPENINEYIAFDLSPRLQVSIRSIRPIKCIFSSSERAIFTDSKSDVI